MARANKYARIMEAAKLYSAVDNLVKYWTDSAKRAETSKVGSGKSRPASQRLYIDPFNIALATGQVVPQSGAKPTWEQYKTAVGARAIDTKPADEANIIQLANYRAARVNITTGRSTTGTKKVSRVTGLPYLDYGGKSTSLPFGRRNETDTQEAAFNEIRAAITTATSGAAVSLIPEQF